MMKIINTLITFMLIGLCSCSSTTSTTGSTNNKYIFNSTGLVRAHRGNAAYGSEQANFGVIRYGNGHADIHLTFRDEGRAIIIKIKEGNWTCASQNCREIRFDRPEQDTWRVTVNDDHTYLIPDAVINGG